MSLNPNRTVCDLAKVQHAILYWKNQEGMVRDRKPTGPTAHGCEIPVSEYAHYHPDYPHETMLERAIRLDILDVWTPHLELRFAANHDLHYTGKKALSLWEAWQAKIFKKSK